MGEVYPYTIVYHHRVCEMKFGKHRA